MTTKHKQFRSLREFYPYYLAEHRHIVNRRLHVLGSSIALVVLALAIFSKAPVLLFAVPIFGYGCAWIGHFVYEKNKPATFKHPLYSLASDWILYKDVLLGKLSLISNDRDTI